MNLDLAFLVGIL